MSGVTELFCIIFVIAVVIVCIGAVCSQVKVEKARNKQLKQDRKMGIYRYHVIHVSGLDAVEGLECQVELSPTVLKFICSNKEYSLPVSRIEYVDNKQDIDEKMYLQSSIARGVAGAALLGVSGAVIGSAPRAKTKTQVKDYAIIGYRSAKGEERVIILKDKPNNFCMCGALIGMLERYVSTQTRKVEL